jgi:hypothetical protein
MSGRAEHKTGEAFLGGAAAADLIWIKRLLVIWAKFCAA